ncbi:LiaG family protein [Metabacillus arenae]|uniref:DUF4097 family beta strand repeat protein n=1 Tax=Metabacillus arenae TaxID=2771434 RepID=A0A926NHC6_9BACI|nr:DUF4097 family beta strand repeat-containing protein [Metabacillus arenae]MBD1381085.1 DUF4097 family beta strand repeat protein [Metabacillus arenae]
MNNKLIISIVILTGIFIALFVNVYSIFPFGNKETEAAVTDSTDELNLKISDAETKVIPVKDNKVRAELKGKGDLNVWHSGNTVNVEYKSNWFEWFLAGENQVTIYLPEDYNRDMSVNVGSGSLTFDHNDSQPFELNEFSLNIGSGEVNLNNLTAKHFDHDGSSGDLAIETLKTVTSEFNISSGSAAIKNFSGKINGEVSSGELLIQMNQLTDSIEFDVSSGDVELDLPTESDFTLKGNASSGEITYDFPLNSVKENDEKIEGTHGSGKHSIDLNVSSGSIELY